MRESSLEVPAATSSGVRAAVESSLEVPAATSSGVRAAVALNNMGLTLLKRNRHEDAMTTLKDALDMMDSLCSEARARPRLTLDDQMAFLDKAYKRVAQSIPSHTPASVLELTLSHTRSLNEISAAIDFLPYSQASCAAVQIDLDGAETDADLITASMLLNLSVACRQRAQNGKRGGKRSRLRHRAYQCAFLADSILSRSVDVLDDDVKVDHALVISILVFHLLFQLASQLGYEDDAKMYYDKFRVHRFLWKKSEEDFLLFSHCQTTESIAAAA
jgi:hypothetical protein